MLRFQEFSTIWNEFRLETKLKREKKIRYHLQFPTAREMDWKLRAVCIEWFVATTQFTPKQNSVGEKLNTLRVDIYFLLNFVLYYPVVIFILCTKRNIVVFIKFWWLRNEGNSHLFWIAYNDSITCLVQFSYINTINTCTTFTWWMEIPGNNLNISAS